MKKINVPLEIIELENNSYHLFIEAEFADQKKGELLIDTGASKTVLDKSFILDSIIEYKEFEEEMISSGINNAIDDIEFVVIKYIKINDLEIRNFPTAIMDLSHLNTIYKKFGGKYFAGLIGSDFLLEYNAEISYKKRLLILEH